MVRRYWQWLRVALRALRAFAHVMYGMVLTLGMNVFLRFFHDERARAIRAHIVQRWFRQLAGVVGLEIRAEGKIVQAPVLFAANHVSWLDIVAISATVPCVFLSKEEVGRWPLIGYLCRHAGTLFISRGADGAAAAATRAMAKRLGKGQSLILFPEGTTTLGRSVRPFHARLFHAAVAAQSPVQAIGLHYPDDHSSNAVVPFVDHQNFITHALNVVKQEKLIVQLTFCPPLDASRLERRELAKRAHHQVLTATGLPPATGPRKRPLAA